jgi:geranylgeranyl diphosphate synthase type I
MNWLKPLYPEIRTILSDSVPDYWPELRDVLGKLIEEPIIPEAMLPLASCKAVNGNPKDAVHVSAALLAMGMSVRIFDDLFDRDKSGELWEQVGPERTWNYAAVVHNLSFEILNRTPLHPDIRQKINQCIIDSFFCLAAGQDRDISGATKTIDEYWQTIEMKSGNIYATACAAGAIAGTENDELIHACGVFGHHLGLTIQIFNDMESIWLPKGITDLKQGKITLPLLYGLTKDHPEKDELKSLVSSNQIASHSERIKEILDNIDTKTFLIWAALKEREQALEAISACPDHEGIKALESFITGMFGDIDSLIPKTEAGEIIRAGIKKN